ncbi:MAG: DUF4405 domain-containing protein [Proteobacteria bacterium]|nr:DUF4405 domain-containing protein [Pseudomonadota bacterium]MBU1139671.1 DUF4405 domain-containing protein [Pseudomonadota bacterium]MBU1234239.1 DUF4405 domain-containing protein [Pseudomonadota bacterium]MBU1420668.1 DUF4405 domain-containing protein [Pseudomonadota bacterium]MBU1454320.1 DUF4405 domain-containing protein [Pseudomonadota bacterium]
MNMRKITSLTMLISFVLEVVTSVVLYIVPHGRVAYWADWHLFGLSKTEWANQHINLGVLFILAGLLHIFYNWKQIVAYLKNRKKEVKVITVSFNVALLFSLVVAVGTYYEIPPMSTVITLSNSIKDKASKVYGEPPYGHAELSSLKLFAKKEGLDLGQCLDLLKQAGVVVQDSSMTLLEIGSANNLPPQKIYSLIEAAKADVTPGEAVVFPDSPMPGFGNKSMAEICAEFNLHFPMIKQGLAEKGVQITPEQTIKEIAAAHDMEGMDIFDLLHAVITGE